MATRFCTICGNLVTTAFCPSCGALQPDSSTGTTETGSHRQEDTPTQAWNADRPGSPLDQEPGTEPYASQAWHPFEQPSWISHDEQNVPPGGVPLLPENGTQYGSYPAAPPMGDEHLAPPQHFTSQGRQQSQSPGTESGPDDSGRASGTGEFMGVSNWQPQVRTAATNRSNRGNWILGGLAAAAVIAVLVAIAFVIIKGNSGKDIATPDTNLAPTTVDATPSSTASTSATTSGSATGTTRSEAPPLTVTATETAAASVQSAASTQVTEPSTEASESTVEATPENPRGGPDLEITCGTGYIVQIASALTDPDFEARVAELRAAGQLPPDVSVATTAGSCQIFTTQTNTLVLYAGPFPDKYAACAARLAGAPDSFIKGTTPETSSEYVSCLCPAAADSLPALTAPDQTGVWVGELQRVLANKLKYKIPDLNGLWGTYSQSTIDAVNSFQTDQGLPVTGQVDAATWQKLQAAEC